MGSEERGARESAQDRRPDDDRSALLTPGSRISPDTHVGARTEQVPPGTSAKQSPADPDALVHGNRVVVAEDMEP